MAADALLRRARGLALFTVAYNLAEAGVSVAFGLREGSLSLVGFGGDSLIEAASACVVLWRFQSVVSGVEDARERAAQKMIGTLLCALAAFMAVSAWFSWRNPSPLEGGQAGIWVALVSLAVMFWLYRAKSACAKALDSRALRADAFCTLSCMWLSGLLLAGSLLLAGTHLRLFDVLTTLGMSWLIFREGAEEYDDSCDCGEAH
jgi:divalent metal cation (Fe/Co/Zn/Cd) transporter